MQVRKTIASQPRIVIEVLVHWVCVRLLQHGLVRSHLQRHIHLLAIDHMNLFHHLVDVFLPVFDEFESFIQNLSLLFRF